jgi:hypothetical protein
MEWLISHPETVAEANPNTSIPPTPGGADTTSNTSGTAGTTGTQEPVNGNLQALSMARDKLRRCLVPRLARVGTLIGGGSALIELGARLANASLPIGDASGTESKPDGNDDRNAIRATNTRVLLDAMLAALKQLSATYPADHPAWAPGQSDSIGSGALDPAEAREARQCLFFTLGVTASLIHQQRHGAVQIIMGLRFLDIVQLVSAFVRATNEQRTAGLPATWNDAFSQGYDVVYGNFALPSAELERLSASAAPPPWFEAAFVVLHEILQLVWLAPLSDSLAKAMEKLSPPRLCAELQTSFVNLALDTLALFPKAGGNLVLAVVFVLRELCSVPTGTAAFINYTRAGLLLEDGGRVGVAEGGGLSVLLRLPRHGRCQGLLRVISDICGQLFEDDAFRAQQIEEQIIKLFTSSTGAGSGGENSTSNTVELRSLLERMQPWIRTSPHLFEEVLKGICQQQVRNNAKEPPEENSTARRHELVLVSEENRKIYRPKTENGIPHQLVLQRILDHLLWSITLDRSFEKILPEASSSVDNNPANNDAAEIKNDAGRASDPKDGSRDGGKKSGKQSSNPMALTADSVIFILQNALACYPQCNAAFARSSGGSTASADVRLSSGAGVKVGVWAPLAERPPELPSGGVFVPSNSKGLPVCASSKSPFAFLLRRILANGFFTGEPSAATASTLGKIAAILTSVSAKHCETRSKILHESVSLLKMLANQAEAGGGQTPRRPGSGDASRRSSSDVGAAIDAVGGEDSGKAPSPGAFATGVGVLCELLVGAARIGHNSPVMSAAVPPPAAQSTPATGANNAGSGLSSTTERPESAARPSASNGGGGAQTAGGQSPTGGVPVTPTASLTPTGGASLLNASESRTLRSVLCRLLAAMSPYHSDTTIVAGHLVRCLELLSRPEVLDLQCAAKAPGSSSLTPSGRNSAERVSLLSGTINSALLGVGGSEDVEMADSLTDVHVVEPPDSLVSNTPVTGTALGAVSIPSAENVHPAAEMFIRNDFDDDSFNSEAGEGTGGRVNESEVDDPDDVDDGMPMLGDENEDDHGDPGQNASGDDDEEFDEDAEEEEDAEGGEDAGDVDEEVAEWDDTDGEESEEDGQAQLHHQHHHHHGAEETISFVVDLGDGRSLWLVEGLPEEASFLQVCPTPLK